MNEIEKVNDAPLLQKLLNCLITSQADPNSAIIQPNRVFDLLLSCINDKFMLLAKKELEVFFKQLQAERER